MSTPADPPRKGPRMAVVITVLMTAIVVISATIGIVSYLKYPN
jgi:hypothetical protein